LDAFARVVCVAAAFIALCLLLYVGVVGFVMTGRLQLRIVFDTVPCQRSSKVWTPHLRGKPVSDPIRIATGSFVQPPPEWRLLAR